jgi:phytoene desaturase
MRIAVIGAGFGGLSAAIRLQAAGHDVTIIEQHDRPGGRAYVFERDGFVFDAGPTIITAPWMVDELFAIAGRAMEDHVRLVSLDPFYRVRFEDGSAFAMTGDEARLIEEVRAFEPRDVDGYRRFSADAERIFSAGFPFVDRPFTTIRDMLRATPDLLRLGAHRSVAALARRHFRDERLQRVFSFHPLLIGGNPFSSTAVYALIHPLEKRWGVWFAMGGTGALVDALATLFVELGGELRLGVPVASIATDAGRRSATGVCLTTGELIAADAVVSNADVAHTYGTLVPRGARRVNTDRRIARWRQSMSLVVAYFGTNRRYEAIAHHEILMGGRYRELLSEIFDARTLPRDFSLYLHRPTATDPSLAPAGCDAWYVLAPVPNLSAKVDWSRESDRYRDAMMSYLADRYLPGLGSHVVTAMHVDPRYFRDRLNNPVGSGFSLEPTLMQSAWFRPHNRSEDLANLYLVGAGTHPGAGIPGVLSSGKIVAELIGSRESRGIPGSAIARQNTIPI